MTSQPFSLPSTGFDLGDEEDDDDAQSQRQCVSCRVLSPKTHTAHTLISAQYGWRLARVALAEGGHRLEWRCPPCWTRFKAAKTLTR
jgi:hypothetical protein